MLGILKKTADAMRPSQCVEVRACLTNATTAVSKIMLKTQCYLSPTLLAIACLSAATDDLLTAVRCQIMVTKITAACQVVPRLLREVALHCKQLLRVTTSS